VCPHPPAPADGPRVLLVDDHDLFRQGLRRMLEVEGVVVVGESASAEAALELLEHRHPNVVVMDLNLPGMNGIEATRHIARRAGAPAVITLTVSAARDDVIDAIDAGAVGYLLKDASANEIARGVRAAAQGTSVLAPEAAAELISRVRRGEAPGDGKDEAPELSDRELQVLRLLAEGRENAEIADLLYISPTTVKHHLSAIFTKLDASNRVQAAMEAARRGLV
jgi:DNA-binding NarL/FixJ family response regulator